MARLGRTERNIMKLAIEAAIGIAKNKNIDEGQKYMNMVTLAFGKPKLSMFRIIRDYEDKEKPIDYDRVIPAHDTGKQVARMWDGTIDVVSKQASPLASSKIWGNPSRVGKPGASLWERATVFRSGIQLEMTDNAKAKLANPEPLKPLDKRHGDKAALDLPKSQTKSVKAYEAYKELKKTGGHKEIPRKYSEIRPKELKPETITIDGKPVKAVEVARNQLILIPLLEEMGYVAVVKGKSK